MSLVKILCHSRDGVSSSAVVEHPGNLHPPELPLAVPHPHVLLTTVCGAGFTISTCIFQQVYGQSHSLVTQPGEGQKGDSEPHSPWSRALTLNCLPPVFWSPLPAQVPPFCQALLVPSLPPESGLLSGKPHPSTHGGSSGMGTSISDRSFPRSLSISCVRLASSRTSAGLIVFSILARSSASSRSAASSSSTFSFRTSILASLSRDRRFCKEGLMRSEWLLSVQEGDHLVVPERHMAEGIPS